jgi:antirestriction protein ArdC
MTERQQLRFADLLREAVEQPGSIAAAYSMFHTYSMGNAMAAMFQCRGRGITPGPIATFPKWKELGRHVKRGERALTLCMPLTCKREVNRPDGEVDTEVFARFVWRPLWFVLAQTDGATEPTLPAVPGFDWDRALQSLKVVRVPFTMENGNCQGYAYERSVAVSPLAYNPGRTLAHEVAHVVLGHTEHETASLSDTETLTHSDREVEAEGTAYIVASVLGLPELDKSRGYLQHWLGKGEVSERSAARIFKAADQILKAGREVSESAEVAS